MIRDQDRVVAARQGRGGVSAREPFPVAINRLPPRRWSDEQRAEIERHLRERGATRCPRAEPDDELRRAWTEAKEKRDGGEQP